MELWCFLLVCHRDCPFVSSAFLKKSGKRKLLHQHSKLKWRHFLKKCGTLSLSVAWTVKRLRTVPYIFYYDFFDRVKCEILKTERKILNNQATRFIYKHLSPGKIPFVVWKDGKIPLTSSITAATVTWNHGYCIRKLVNPRKDWFPWYFLSKIHPGVLGKLE